MELTLTNFLLIIVSLVIFLLILLLYLGKIFLLIVLLLDFGILILFPSLLVDLGNIMIVRCSIPCQLVLALLQIQMVSCKAALFLRPLRNI